MSTSVSSSANPGLDWHARRVTPRTIPFINGAWAEPISTASFVDVNPATGRTLWKIADCGAADVDSAVRAARTAFDDGRWRHLPPLYRKAILLRVADLIEAHREELALLDSLEMGKPISAALGEVVVAAGFFRFYAETIDKLYGQVAPSERNCLALAANEPRGVIGAITPWNYPLCNAAIKLAPALAAGNSVVIKPSEVAPLSSLRLAELAVEAGLPPGVFNAVPGSGSAAGNALAHHGDVDLLTFTGSTLTGRRILRASADSNAKPTILECGGKSPQLVFRDVSDLAAVARQVVIDAFENQGQLCVAKTRLLVDAEIADEFMQHVVEAAGSIRAGDPLDPATLYGPVASRAQKERVLGYVESGKQQGARLRFAAEPAAADDAACFVPGVIFDRVDPAARIAQEEIFGPVLSCFTFTKEEEAVRLANDSAYGLAATIWTGDLGRGVRLSHSIRAGRIQFGGAPVGGMGAAYSLPAEPVAQSGFGVEGGVAGILPYTHLKAITLLG
ncbi:MAG: aldehyde dehydrogenase family protein [Rudaea sp.]|uniref:aldehyde dehydrogenase family protein n=1 Tax=unclassified Rudaea TaxID=2627037 RepID=UPI0014857E13|nr:MULTISPECIES: aldehyde dehydrogenase family protein [unclassified Rudaea]MBN8885029.1 aldehyde dehydrogenase family protein [Rudaea sp.]MBR0347850.1 aldehyde dehydrogenase family protein [Rudaea sp.]